MKLQFIQKMLMLLTFTLVGISVSYSNSTVDDAGKIYNGFVITASGDTLHGQLEMLSPTMNQIKVKFIDSEGNKEMYKAKDLQAYSFKIEEWDKSKKENVSKWINYAKKTVERPPVPFASTEVLIQQEIVGKISIYNYYIETRSDQSMEHIVYLEKGNVLYIVDDTNYKTVLKSLMDDIPFMSDRVGTKGYTYKFLPDTIVEYNQQLRKSSESNPN